MEKFVFVLLVGLAVASALHASGCASMGGDLIGPELRQGLAAYCAADEAGRELNRAQWAEVLAPYAIEVHCP